MRSMCGADAGCLPMNYQSLCRSSSPRSRPPSPPPSSPTPPLRSHARPRGEGKSTSCAVPHPQPLAAGGGVVPGEASVSQEESRLWDLYSLSSVQSPQHSQSRPYRSRGVHPGTGIVPPLAAPWSHVQLPLQLFDPVHAPQETLPAEGRACKMHVDTLTQLKAQGPSRTCNESKEEEEATPALISRSPWQRLRRRMHGACWPPTRSCPVPPGLGTHWWRFNKLNNSCELSQ